ncbi:MAG: acetate/propionate family kinase [Candidatus Obscuribacter sp.]|nr:acetate/propionate family kinase [Candidatus Obscuribacter sp.]MBK9277358.1 acetate/propionate family kinase [Candidatus Obscuribacter sp.]
MQPSDKQDKVIVFNYGSSSLKAAVFQLPAARLCTFKMELKDLPPLSDAEGVTTQAETRESKAHRATVLCLKELEKQLNLPLKDATCLVAHRIVHGGTNSRPLPLDDRVKNQIRELSEFAPLHNPGSLAVVQAAQSALPAVPHIACFDTAFHQTKAAEARYYGLPIALTRKLSIERYGFHGINAAHVTAEIQEFLRPHGCPARLLICHLGAGASLTAVKDGESVDNTMGFTPLDGLIMNSRVGSIDPGALLYIMTKENLTPTQAEAFLNHDCGLKGLSGTSDLRELLLKEADGDEDCRLAWQVYCYRLKLMAGAMIAAMGGLDAVAFTGGIGENSPPVRRSLINDLAYMGARLNHELNESPSAGNSAPARQNGTSTGAAGLKEHAGLTGLKCIAAPNSIPIFIVPADEELAMVKMSSQFIKSTSAQRGSSK